MKSKLIQCKSELKEFLGKLSSKRIALVPTMGALHQGHISLIEKAKTLSQDIIVSIFVNPSQFGPGEGLSSYPRTLSKDLIILNELGVQAVFAPNSEEIYPRDFQTYIYNSRISENLCGTSRMGHFQGVCTIVLKLINLIRPKWIFFGKKDYQQYKIIEQMITDLDLETKIIACELIRNSRGLALSSRNKSLSEEEAELALSLYHTLKLGKDLVSKGERNPEHIEGFLKKKLMVIEGISLDYLEIRNAKDLTKSSPSSILDSILFGAIKIGSTRLIDNMPLS
ncbi:MAG: pantoate--beta-alanine ligase [Oligoflexales bacterium]